jgi:glycosyltransferase 2 family protein
VRVAGTVLALGLVGLLLYRQGWNEIFGAASQISPWRLLLAFILTILSRLCVSGRWHVLLRSAGLPATAWQTIRLTFAGLFASNFLPTTVGGDVIRLGGGLRLKWDQPALFASLVVDRLVGMAGMFLVAPLGLPALLASSLVRAEVTGAGGLLMAQLGMLPGGRLGKFGEKIWNALRRTLSALSLWLGRPRALLGSLAFTGGHMFFLFSSLWLLLSGMGEPVPFWLIGGLWGLSYFITLLPISINGLGVQELSVTLLFSAAGGVSEPGSLTLALFIRLLQMFASLPGSISLPDLLVGKEIPQA